jgi:hypothetical protein
LENIWLRPNRKKKAGKRDANPRHEAKIRWQIVLGCLLAAIAQFFLEPDHRSVALAVCIYLAAGILLWLSYKNSNLNAFDRERSAPVNLFQTIFG